MPRRALRDDIPLARRTVRPVRSSAATVGPVLITAVLVLVTGVGVVLLVPGPIRRLLSPPPVAGLDARLSADGRLLGHFPYPEAPADRLASVAPGLQLRPDAAEALLAMQRAARADGVELRVLSAFRPVALQKEIFFGVKAERNQSAEERAQVSAPPGFSEHSTGYAVDLGDASRPATNLSASFEATPAFGWLEANANRFHFQLSFPRDNGQGVTYEPWHWRFEGSADALRQFEPARRLSRSLAGSPPP